MFLILTLIILVAAFNIISSMIMLVYDKTSSIAILRTMGASRAAITRIFFSIRVDRWFCWYCSRISFGGSVLSKYREH